MINIEKNTIQQSLKKFIKILQLGKDWARNPTNGRDLCLIKTNEDFIQMASDMGGRLLEPRRDSSGIPMEGSAAEKLLPAGWLDTM